jgi:8-oxo-dGTP pyrophosphatase MutT (NUDIX family)
MLPDFIQQLQLQLLTQLPGFAAQCRMMPPSRTLVQAAPKNAKIGGVMVVLFWQKNQWQLLLMQRTADGGAHSGQISFAGGKYDATDGCVTYTAMRELHEEMGIDQTTYTILGQLTPLYIPPSNFYVTPVLCVLHNALVTNPNIAEVQAVLQMPLKNLFHVSIKKQINVRSSDDKKIQMITPAYQLNNNLYIWGATAMMLSELEILLLRCDESLLHKSK